MDAILCETPFAPSSLYPTKLRELNKWGLCVDFAAGNPEDNIAAKKVRSSLRAAAQNCDLETRDRPWHATLAYRRNTEPIPPAVVEEVHMLVDACLQESFHLASARVCYHPDMTTFVPLVASGVLGSAMHQIQDSEEKGPKPKPARRWKKSSSLKAEQQVEEEMGTALAFAARGGCKELQAAVEHPLPNASQSSWAGINIEPSDALAT